MYSFSRRAEGNGPRGATGAGAPFLDLLYTVLCALDRKVAVPVEYTTSASPSGGGGGAIYE